ncbi:MAG TPA: VTT domain-containing protein [Thermoleophilaceae bacterium]
MARRERRLSGRTALVVLFLVVGGLTLAGTGLLPRPEEFRENVESWGALGAVAVFGIAVAHAVVSFPSEILNIAAGYAYGFWAALVLMMAAWTASCLVAYWLARSFGDRIANRFVEPAALDRLRDWAADAPVPVLLAVRAIPIMPINLLSYAAGLARMPLWRFTWTTVAGLTPQFGLPIYAGSQARDVSITDPTIWGSGLAWVAMIAIGWWAYRRLAPSDTTR